MRPHDKAPPYLSTNTTHEHMKAVYKLTPNGWEKVQICQSFAHACKIALQLEAETKTPHCVNR